MKYHYRTGLKKSRRAGLCKIIWWLVAIFCAVMLYDLIFNNCNWFVQVMIWTWES